MSMNPERWEGSLFPVDDDWEDDWEPPADRVLGDEEAALGRVRILAERWAALAGDDLGAAVDRRIGGVLLDAISKDPRPPEARLEHVRQLAEHWLTPGATLFYPAAGQCVLDAINNAAADLKEDWPRD